jgi:hypothetical protein
MRKSSPEQTSQRRLTCQPNAAMLHIDGEITLESQKNTTKNGSANPHGFINHILSVVISEKHYKKHNKTRSLGSFFRTRETSKN